MKKWIFALGLVAALCSNASAYYIDGKSLTLLDCSMGLFKGEYGWIGIYKDGLDNIYRVFFDDDYCEY